MFFMRCADDHQKYFFEPGKEYALCFGCVAHLYLRSALSYKLQAASLVFARSLQLAARSLKVQVCDARGDAMKNQQRRTNTSILR